MKLYTANNSYIDGFLSELFVINKLKKDGFRVLKHRYLSPLGEIDIIVSKENTITFIEVKYRKDKLNFYHCIDTKKVYKIFKTAEYYISMFYNNSYNIDYKVKAWFLSPYGYEINDLYNI